MSLKALISAIGHAIQSCWRASISCVRSNKSGVGALNEYLLRDIGLDQNVNPPTNWPDKLPNYFDQRF